MSSDCFWLDVRFWKDGLGYIQRDTAFWGLPIPSGSGEGVWLFQDLGWAPRQ